MKLAALGTRYCVATFFVLIVTLGSARAETAPAAQNSTTAVISANASSTSSVPPLVRFAGVAKELNGSPLTASTGITFLIYSAQEGGSPLWLETQNVQPDSVGQYSVLLGATKAEGLPADLFASGQARWLAVQISSQPEQPRVLLLSVPYALKAADADTVGGLPASAFLLATPANAAALSSSTASPSTAQAQSAVATGVTPDAPTPVTGSGTASYLPLWTTASNIGNSNIFQSSSGFIGINNPSPQVTLDVMGNTYFRGGFTIPAQNTATATTGYTSHSYYFIASSYNSTSKTAANQTFQWQAEPEGNNTPTPSGLLNLRFGEGTASPLPTGFGIASNGIVTFATAQTFPGSPLLSGANTFTGNQTVTGSVTATSFAGNGTGLTNVTAANSSALGGLPVSSFAQLAAANTFAGETTLNAKEVISAESDNYAALFVTQTGAGNGSAGAGNGIDAFTDAPKGYGVSGISPNVGVYGNTSATSGAGAGVLGTVGTGSPYAYGVWGQTNASLASNDGVGVVGSFGNFSSVGVSFGQLSGVWGDIPDGVPNIMTGGTYPTGILGTADNNYAGAFYNESKIVPTIYAQNFGAGGTGLVLKAEGSQGTCSMSVTGDLGCTGKVVTAADVEGGARKVALYSVQSPENWFEDFGSGTLTNGSATVALEPTFAQTVNTGAEYHVFLTPNGDCKGLYVTNKSSAGFEVRELGGGGSSVSFDYRIVAKRAGFETVRLADITAQLKKNSLPVRRPHSTAPPAAIPGPAAAPKTAPVRPATNSPARNRRSDSSP